MTDSPRRDAPDPTQPLPYGYPGYTDPAYANQAPHGTSYQPPPFANPTQQLPPYGYDPGCRKPVRPAVSTGRHAAGATRPERPRATALAVGDRGSRRGGRPRPGHRAGHRQQLAAADRRRATAGADGTELHHPDHHQPGADHHAPHHSQRRRPPTRRPTNRRRRAETETVVYDVTGTGRAINITYVDAGGVLQTEFNVMLPWSKEVQLTKPADRSASVSIINVGREISCSITLAGRQIRGAHGIGPDDLQRAGLSVSGQTGAPGPRASPPGPPPVPGTSPPRPARLVPKTSMNGEEHPRREERHRTSGGGVEAERHALLALGRHPQHLRSRRRLRRPDEQTQQQPADPERQGPRQGQQDQAHDHHRGQRADDDGLGPDAVVEQPTEHRTDRGDHAGAHTEQQHVRPATPRTPSPRAPPRTRTPPTVRPGRPRWPTGSRRVGGRDAIRPSPRSTTRRRPRGTRRRVDLRPRPVSRAVSSRGSANNSEPRRGEQHRRPHGLPVGRRDAQQAAGVAVALDEPEIDDQQQ